MITLSCYMMLRLYREEASKPYITQHYPIPGTIEFEETIEIFREDFLDDVFADKS